ncbi:serum paraoxonase/arylesterase 2-like isoform X1 [Lytechinus pictus]|uniref:serum paraoxonase/arylesterase 2-like isoform X1 n=1 Tax=Lytechinus pictus TaxID=7653 RepID=UPI0030B9F2C1
MLTLQSSLCNFLSILPVAVLRQILIKMWLSIRSIVTYIVFAVVIDQLARIAYMMGFHKTVYTHYPGKCRALPGIENGSEDIVTSSNGLAFISAGVLKAFEPDQDILGKVFLFDFNYPDDDPKNIQIVGFDPSDWIPFGMDIWESGPKDNPTLTLYVINRHPDRIGIEVFDFSYQKKIPTLTHQRRIHHKNIWSPNDLVLVDENHFYASNDKYLPEPFNMLEVFFRLGLASVVYYDGEEARIVAEGVKLANGVNISPDKKLLYVAGTIGNELLVYRIQNYGNLVQAKAIQLGTSPDNINIDKEDGSVWIGNNPVMYHFFNQLGKFTGVGQVLNMHLDKKLNPTIREVLSDNTGLIRYCSVACRYGNRLLIGTVADKAAYCEGVTF